jgi:hypothetical protein
MCHFSMPGKEVPTGRDEVGNGKTTAEMHAEVAQPSNFSLPKTSLLEKHTDINNNNITAVRKTSSLQSRTCKYRNPNADHRHSAPSKPSPRQLTIHPRLQLPDDEEEKSDLAKYLASWKRHLHERHDSYRPRALYQVSPHNTPHLHLRLHICGHVGWPGCLFCNDQASKWSVRREKVVLPRSERSFGPSYLTTLR